MYSTDLASGVKAGALDRNEVPQGKPSAPFNPQDVINEHRAAEFLKLSVSTLRQWRHACKPPKYLKFGRAVRYRVADLHQFSEESSVSPLNSFRSQ